MTYCVAIKVNEGLVFCSDTRTSSGVDDIRTYNKLHVYEYPGDRVLVLLAAGNLATTQALLAQIDRDIQAGAKTSLTSVTHIYAAAEYVGRQLVKARKQSSQKNRDSDVDFRATMIIGGQIAGEAPALYLVYPEGNCISASPESSYLQAGELKYGKPILDRVIKLDVSLGDAARCALVSMDSTMKSNLTVGPPLDLALLRTDELRISQKLRFDTDTPIYAEISKGWGQQLLNAFRHLPRFDWETGEEPTLQMAAHQEQQQQHR